MILLHPLCKPPARWIKRSDQGLLQFECSVVRGVRARVHVIVVDRSLARTMGCPVVKSPGSRIDGGDVQGLADRKEAVVARAFGHTLRPRVDDRAQAPGWRLAAPGRPREEVPVSGRAVPHRGIRQVVRGQRKEIQPKAGGAVDQGCGRHVHETNLAQVLFAHLQFTHSASFGSCATFVMRPDLTRPFKTRHGAEESLQWPHQPAPGG